MREMFKKIETLWNNLWGKLFGSLLISFFIYEFISVSMDVNFLEILIPTFILVSVTHHFGYEKTRGNGNLPKAHR